MKYLQNGRERVVSFLGKVIPTIVGIIVLYTWSNAIPFERTIGGPLDDEGYSITINEVGALFVAGRTMSFGQGNWDLYVAKLRLNGVLKWANAYGKNNWDRAWAIRPESTRVVVVGNSNSIGAGGQDALFVRLRGTNGDFKGFPKTYGGATLERGYSIEPTADGGFIIVGEATSFGPGDKDVYVIKTSERGKVIWAFTYGIQESNEVGRSIQQTSDGGYIVTGWTDYYGNKKILVFKLNGAGGLVWSKIYGGFGNEIGRAVREDPDGNYIVTGWTTSWDLSDVFLMKLNNLGNLQWFFTYGGNNSDAGTWVEIAPDGGYIVAGQTNSFATGGLYHDGLLIKTDNAGNVVWSKTYGGTGDDVFQAVVVVTPTGGYGAVGKTNSFSFNGDYDLYVVNTNNLGQTGCETGIIIDAVSRSILQQDLTLSPNDAFAMTLDTLLRDPGGAIEDVCQALFKSGTGSLHDGIQSKPSYTMSSQATFKVIGRSIVLNRTVDYNVYSITGSLIKQGMGNVIRFSNPGVYFIKLDERIHKITILK